MYVAFIKIFHYQSFPLCGISKIHMTMFSLFSEIYNIHYMLYYNRDETGFNHLLELCELVGDRCSVSA